MYNKGVVILVPFPFTDLSATKIRPAVIISDRKVGDDVVVAFITSRPKRRLHQFDVLIRQDQPDFVATGLKASSVINVGKVATLDRKIILGELGRINTSIQTAIEGKLKLLFGL